MPARSAAALEDRMSQTNDVSAVRTAPDLETLPPSNFLTRAQLAPIIGFSVPTLKRWAAEGLGPKVTYLENRPRYQVRDVLAWAGVTDD